MDRTPTPFRSEADLVAAVIPELVRSRRDQTWTAYHETAGWDVLLVEKSGVQVGIEAKMSLNAKVLEQALPGRWHSVSGPDFRAVLVPSDRCQQHLTRIACHLGIVVITAERNPYGGGVQPVVYSPYLPRLDGGLLDDTWHNWLPSERCTLPEYVPDVCGGHQAPITLSPWKIKAIKLLILLERQGAVTRGDMKALDLAPTRWTDRYNGFLDATAGGYVRNHRTPDLRAQHPDNWKQIEADFERWSKPDGAML